MLRKISLYILSFLVVFILLSFVWLYFSTFNPPQEKVEKHFNESKAKILEAGQKIKVLSWNVQYMASKNYVFFYDKLDGSGPDQNPSKQSIDYTLSEVARVIVEEDPDIVLLQEVDDNAKRTGYQDQLEQLLLLLPAEYANHSSSFYWKNAFVPHPKIMGRTGMKLSIISKYKIKQTVRYSLPDIPSRDVYTWVKSFFNLKRCIQDTRLPVRGGKDLMVLNTHFSAFAQGTNAMEKQVSFTRKLLSDKVSSASPWLIGGDFNLLPNKKAYKRLEDWEKEYYNPQTELEPLQVFASIPSLQEVNGSHYWKWFTHFPNDERLKSPSRTIDYIFYSKRLKLEKHYVLQKNTWHISDHLPIVAEFVLP